MAIKTTSNRKTTSSSTLSSTYSSTVIIMQVVITDSNYDALDDTAVSSAGGYIKIFGIGFMSGYSLYYNGVAIATSTLVSSNEIRAVIPSIANGTYNLTLFNSNNTGALYVLTASGFPTWTTGTYTNQTGVVSVQLLVTGDAPLTYSLQAGSSLPNGVTLSSSGLLSGTLVGVSSNATYTFVVLVNDVQNQTTQETITLNVFFADPQFNYTTLLLTGETTVMPFINDASTNSFALTIQGDTKPVLFNPYQEGYYSNFFDGTGDYLSVSTGTIAIGTGDLTLECWGYRTSTTTLQSLVNINAYNTGILIRWETTKVTIYVGGTDYSYNTPTDIPLNSWVHIALVRSGGVFKFYVNGTQATTFNSSYSLSVTSVTIGTSSHDTSDEFYGYISNVRLVNSAIYTTAFTPSTTPLTAIANTSLLTCQSNRFIDNSTNNFTITKAGDVSVSPAIPFTQNSSYSTYGSTYFDGTGDYLSVPSNAAFEFGTGDFTIECFYYRSGIKGNSFHDNILGNRPTSYGSGQWHLYVGPAVGGAFTLHARTLSGDITVSGGACVENAWNYLTVVRNGTSLTLFVNGINVNSTTTSASIGDSVSNLSIGAFNDGAYPTIGYISNVRVVKGTAVYTTAFTPPTVPLTAVANTSLLTLQYNGGANNSGIIDNSNFNNIITRNGNTSQGSFSPYSVSGWSNYFDTSGTQYISLPTSTATAFGGFNSNYTTIEFWAFQTTSSTGATNEVIGTWAAVAVNGRFYVEIGNGASSTGATSKVFFTWTTSTGAVDSITTTAVVSVNQWVHIAIVVDATPVAGSHTVNIYVNGTGQSFTGRNFSSQTTTYDRLRIAGNSSSYFNGYLSNLRVVRGTSNIVGYSGASITVPANPFVPSIGTVLLTCQSNRFIDNSPINSTLTLLSNPSVQAFDPFGSVPEAVPISYSNFFDGSGDYLDIPAGNSQLNLGTGDFTIEFWLYANSTAGGALVDCRNPDSTNAGFGIELLAPNKIRFSTSGLAYIDSATAISVNTWYHIALVRASNIFKLYINGSADANTYTGSATQNFTNTNYRIGSGQNGAFSGYLSNLRIIKGTALYTATFTPSITSLTAIANTSLLTCQSTRMIDNSSNYFAITAVGDTKPRIFNPFGYTAQSTTSYNPSLHGGSVYLDGTTDYLTAASNSVFGYGTGDFTIEFWFNPNSTGLQTVFSHLTSGVSINPHIYIDTTIRYFTNDGVRITGSTLSIGQWHHIALCRASGSTRLFINGTQSGTTYSDSNNYGTTAPLGIGTYWSSGSPVTTNTVNGYLSDIRVTKGFAIYTSNFVPPTQTIGNYSTTYPASLLLNFNNGGIIDQHGTNVLETVGNAQLSTQVKKYNNASMYFDGTGDSLKILDNPNINLGLGDFTLECWVYFNVVNTEQVIFSKGWQSSSAYASYMIYMTSGASLRFGASTNGGSWDIANEKVIGTMTAGAWAHVAVTRSGTSFRAFINGVINNSFTFTSSASLASIAAQTLFIGGRTDGNSTMNGYLDDLRITKGYARYTANFTAPTSALVGQ